MEDGKVCGKCNTFKSYDSFHKSKNHKMGYQTKCKQCSAEFAALYKLKNPDYARNYYNNNKNKAKSYYENNKSHIISRNKAFYEANRERLLYEHQRYFKQNRASIIKKNVERTRQRLKSDPQFRMLHNLRSRISKAIFGQKGSKSERSTTLLGASLDVVKTHIECKFLPGMTWENHGLHGWHIDHIRPLSSFDLTDPEQQKLAFNYTNLQPLWALDNLKKSDKWEESLVSPQ